MASLTIERYEVCRGSGMMGELVEDTPHLNSELEIWEQRWRCPVCRKIFKPKRGVLGVHRVCR